MRLLVTGATGFTGRRVVARLLEAGHAVRCFLRPTSRRESLDGAAVEIAVGDLADPASLEGALAGRDALVFVASLGFGHAPGVVAACERAAVARAVFFSTTAIFTTLPAPSRSVRLAAEEAIRGSGLDWTILRPTMIYGAPGDRNVERLLRALVRWPAFPVVGGGGRLVQPVLVDDLAEAVAAVLGSPATIRRAYCVPGRAPVTFRRLVEMAAGAAGTRTRIFSVPARLAVGAARVLEGVKIGPRIRAEQVERLLEDKDFDWAAARRDFGYDPADVEGGLATLAGRMGLGGVR